MGLVHPDLGADFSGNRRPTYAPATPHLGRGRRSLLVLRSRVRATSAILPQVRKQSLARIIQDSPPAGTLRDAEIAENSLIYTLFAICATREFHDGGKVWKQIAADSLYSLRPLRLERWYSIAGGE